MPKRYEIYLWIINYKRAYHGDSPSLEEIRAGVGLKARSTVMFHLKNLANDGQIKIESIGAGHNLHISIPGAIWKMEGES